MENLYSPNRTPQYTRICLKIGSVESKMHIGSTFENDFKGLDPRKAYKYLGIEESLTYSIRMRKKTEEGMLEEIETSFGYRIKCKE